MATACRPAAVLLGFGPPPRCPCPTAAIVKCDAKISRNVAVKTMNGSSGEGSSSTELPEIVKAAQDAWEKVDDKYAVATVAVAALVALWTATGVVKAIDNLPLLPGFLELVGIGYTGWFTYRNLVFQPDREALLCKIEATFNDIIGSS